MATKPQTPLDEIRLAPIDVQYLLQSVIPFDDLLERPDVPGHSLGDADSPCRHGGHVIYHPDHDLFLSLDYETMAEVARSTSVGSSTSVGLERSTLSP